MEVPQVILNRRAAVNRWKQANYAYYLAQKGPLHHDPSTAQSAELGTEPVGMP